MGPLETFGNRVVVGWRFRFQLRVRLRTSLGDNKLTGHRKKAVSLIC